MIVDALRARRPRKEREMKIRTLRDELIPTDQVERIKVSEELEALAIVAELSNGSECVLARLLEDEMHIVRYMLPHVMDPVSADDGIVNMFLLIEEARRKVENPPEWKPGIRKVNGQIVNTKTDEFWDHCTLEVEVGTNGFRGGDTGHGSRTYIRLKDLGSTDIHFRVNPSEYEAELEIMLGGDAELDMITKVFRWIADTLDKQAYQFFSDETENDPS